MTDPITITHFVGIDAGVHTGFALWDAKAKAVITLKTMTFFGCLHTLLILQQSHKNCLAVIIEDPTANKPTFRQRKAGKDQAVIDRISQNVGANKRDCALIKQFCDIHAIPSFLVKPDKKSLSKLDAQTFNRIFNYTGQSSQHARDAAGLVFNRTSEIYRPESNADVLTKLFIPIGTL